MRLSFLLLLSSWYAFAQIDSTQTRLDSIAITAYRFTDRADRLPYSVSVLRFRESGINSITSKQQLNLKEYLTGVPGLFALNENNYAQDLRISIRGFGARSPFGIRGIKLIVDGIPETTPDGQGQLDNLNLGIIEQIQVLRGPAAILYGNASGGAIDIHTRERLDSTYVEASGTVGSYGMDQQHFTYGLKGTSSNTVLNMSRTGTEGYRDRSGFESYNLNLKHKHSIGRHRWTGLINYVNSPYAQDPGSLDLESVNRYRRQSRDRNRLFDTQEEVEQLKLGVSHNFTKDQWEWKNYAFYSYRDFMARLPFINGGVVDIHRNYGGVGTSITYTTQFKDILITTSTGLDYGYQNDARRRFDNQEGILGDPTLDQREIFSALGAYVHQRFSYKRWQLLAGLRYDTNLLKVDDGFLIDGDASDSENLNSWSSSAGVSYRWKRKTLFANVSTSFETPVLSELSANPSNTGGFNPDLAPQRAVNYELGYRLNVASGSMSVAAFYIKTSNDIVPFELSAFPDRTFFRNAGSTDRLGVEIEFIRKISSSFALSGSYTYADFTYANYQANGEQLKGNRLPAIPANTATTVLTYDKNKFNLQLKGSYRGSLFTNDQNTIREPDFVVLNITGAYRYKLNNARLTLFGGLNNFLDTTYNDNIRINAFGGRYFEPAPGINFYTGVRVKL
ncbi:MAG: TonB-dependent receptor [Nonlabens sp.]